MQKRNSPSQWWKRKSKCCLEITHRQSVKSAMPDSVRTANDSTRVVKEQTDNPSERTPAVLQASTTTSQTDTSPVSKSRPDDKPHEPVESAPVQPELSPRQRLLRPERQRAMPEIDVIGSQFEATSFNRIIKSMTSHVEGHPLFQRVRGSLPDRQLGTM